MPTTILTFRVFASSTFEDPKEERDALQTEVFPGLQRLCEECEVSGYRSAMEGPPGGGDR
jgi:hypothetical protein